MITKEIWFEASEEIPSCLKAGQLIMANIVPYGVKLSGKQWSDGIEIEPRKWRVLCMDHGLKTSVITLLYVG